MAAETTLAALRRKANLTQLEMADVFEMSQAGISRWETLSRIPMEDLPRIHAYFVDVLGADAMEGIDPLDLIRPWEKVVARNARRARRAS